MLAESSTTKIVFDMSHLDKLKESNFRMTGGLFVQIALMNSNLFKRGIGAFDCAHPLVDINGVYCFALEDLIALLIQRLGEFLHVLHHMAQHLPNSILKL